MYIDRLLLPAMSNREDLYTTVGIYDDDTGQPIKLDGCYVNGASAYTGSAWTVTDGAIVTTSSTSFTIPVFPYTGQLTSLSITVGTGLGILAGDLAIIADTATGLNYVQGYVTGYSSATGALTMQVGMMMEFEIRYDGPRNQSLDDYAEQFYVGQVLNTPPLISASLGNGISIVDLGMIQIRIPAATISGLQRQTYSAALAITDGYDTRQLFVAELPVLYGGVSANNFSGGAYNPLTGN